MSTNTSPEVADLDRPLWGASAIAQVIGRTERQVFHLLENGHLPAEKIGKIWVSTPRRLLARIVGPVAWSAMHHKQNPADVSASGGAGIVEQAVSSSKPKIKLVHAVAQGARPPLLARVQRGEGQWGADEFINDWRVTLLSGGTITVTTPVLFNCRRFCVAVLDELAI
jgi:hypothetical protein